MGGDAAISEDVVTAAGEVGGTPSRRIAGADRFETAVAAAREAGPAGSVYVATGNDFADALTAVPVALRSGGLITLVQPDVVPDPVAALIEELDPFEILVLGGTAAVSAEVEASLTPQ